MRAAAVLAAMLVAQPAMAAGPPPEEDDAAALALPTAQQGAKPGAGAFSLTTEGALTTENQRFGGLVQTERLTFDARYDAQLAPGLRLVASDLLDLEWTRFFDKAQAVNTFKEGYLSWQAASNLIVDAGRINARQGVAYGYNPTDFLRTGAVRTVDSLDPNALRQNRLGTGMLRAQTLWDSGAVTALFAPKLAESASSGPFNPDFGATNARNRWMLAASQRVYGDVTPQLLLYGGDGGSPQAGVNLTYLIGSATIAYVEASGGHQTSLWSQAGNAPDDAALRGRAAAGFTYSARNKLSITLEYEYDGAALGRDQWNAVRRYDLPAYGRYRNFVGTRQDLPTQHNAFVYVSWQDLWVRNLDLSAFVRYDVADHSALPWSELRYHWTRFDAALRWLNFNGGVTSDYGASPVGRTWQAVVDYYL